jgi:hypothetical protein
MAAFQIKLFLNMLLQTKKQTPRKQIRQSHGANERVASPGFLCARKIQPVAHS